MLENSKNETQSSPIGSSAESALARRRLIRAGLAVAPVMLGLKSQSALATGTTNYVKPSCWSSLKVANGCLSHGGGQVGGTCKPHTYWKTQNAYPNYCNDYTKTRFHQTTSTKKTGQLYCPPFSGTVYTGKNCRDVLSLAGSSAVDKLARHCTAMFMNAKESPLNCPVSTTTCQTIWQNCSGGGTWTPAVGAVPWTIDDCNDYFDYVCGIPNQHNPPVSPNCGPTA